MAQDCGDIHDYMILYGCCQVFECEKGAQATASLCSIGIMHVVDKDGNE